MGLALLGAAPAALAPSPDSATLAQCDSLTQVPEAARAAQLRTCFQERVLPALRRAERDAAALDGAASGFLGWLRQAQLLGFAENAFPEEHRAGKASLELGLKNAYAKAREHCRRSPGLAAIKELMKIAHMSMLHGWSEDHMLFPTFDDDVRMCTPTTYYRITVRSTQAEGRHGVTKDIRYVAMLVPGVGGEGDELEGSGTYSGFVISTPNEVPDGKGGCTAAGPSMKFPVRGELEASGMFMDLSALGGPNGLTYTLASIDWPLMPFFVDAKDAYAQTEEEKDGVKGLATIFRLEPVPLTGHVTVKKEVTTRDGGQCAGTVTDSDEIRIERIGR